MRPPLHQAQRVVRVKTMAQHLRGDIDCCRNSRRGIVNNATKLAELRSQLLVGPGLTLVARDQQLCLQMPLLIVQPGLENPKVARVVENEFVDLFVMLPHSLIHLCLFGL